MSKVPDLREKIVPPEEIIHAALNGDFVMFVGAGASMLLGLPSWRELAGLAFEDLREQGLLNFSDIDQLIFLDPRKQLSIARLIADEHGHRLDLNKHLTERKRSDIFESLNAIGCPFVTTNYDELIKPRYRETKDGSTTSVPITRIAERSKLFSNLLDSPGTVVHLHGRASQPETMIVTTQDYLEHYDDRNVRTFLSELFQKKTVLFVGYGLEETEILEHILRRGHAASGTTRARFSLQGFFRSQQPLYENLYRYYEKSFGVHLLGFLRDHDDYGCLAGIVADWARTLEIRRPPLTAEAELISEVLGDV